MIFQCAGLKSQRIGNYISNGSFERYFMDFIYPIPYNWAATDSAKAWGELLVPPNRVPLSSYAYQWPKHGKNTMVTLFYCPACGTKRGYPKNRLKQTLQANVEYCVRMYVSLSNQSTHGIDNIGVYFSDNSIDTIKKCNNPITYLMPQVRNPTNNIITDTLNWVAITGTFVATGTEKYLLIGNFESDANTNKSLVNPTHSPGMFSDYVIDAISVIPVNLSAYAGRDTSIVLGGAAFIGREPDFAIDSGCVWFKMPGMTPLDTISGMWVSPSITTTYVVKQNLECSSEKWDTVVVYVDLVGLEKLKVIQADLKLYPVPAKNFIEICVSDPNWLDDFKHLSIYNTIGQLIRHEELRHENNRARIQIDDLDDGMYSLVLRNSSDEKLYKKLLVAR